MLSLFSVIYSILASFITLIGGYFYYTLFVNKREINSKDVILLTGAAGGVGKFATEKFAKLGCKLILIDRNSEDLNKLKKLIEEQYKVDVFAAGIDLIDHKEVEKYLVDLHDRGLDPTIFVHNAAIAQSISMRLNSVEDFEYLMGVNVSSFVNIIRLIFPIMLQKNKGCIVSVASILSTFGFSKFGSYCASKAALARLMDTLKHEAYEAGKTGIQFTTLYPAKIDTKLFERTTYKKYVNFILPVLSPNYVASQIIDGIKKNRPYIYLPQYLGILLNILPASVIMYVSSCIKGE